MKKKVLVMDRDDRQIQRIAGSIRNVAVQLGCRVDIFGTGSVEEAERIAEENDLDLLITDVVLYEKGKYEGISWVEHLRKSSKYAMLPIIFISADEKTREYAYKEINCMGYFTRKFKAEELQKVLVKGMQNMTPKEEERYIMLRVKGIFYPMQIKEILYAKVAERILFVYCADGNVFKMPNKTLRDFQNEMESRYMIPLSRNLLVNLFCVDRIDHEQMAFVLKGDGRLVVGKKEIARFEKAFCTVPPRYILK